MASNVTRSAGTLNLSVKAGSYSNKVDSTGQIVSFTLEGHHEKWLLLKPSITLGGPSSQLSSIITGVPSGVYLDSYEEKVTFMRSAVAGGATQPGAIEVGMVYKDVNSLTTGSSGVLGSPTPVPVYEIEWAPSEIPLAGHSVRYPNLKDTASGFRSYYDFFQAYVNAGLEEKAEIGIQIQALSAGAGKNQLYDIINAYRQGIEAKRIWHPILTKTTTRSTAPTIEEIGMIDEPSGFGTLVPDGYTFLKSSYRVSRTGRSGAHNCVEQWEGAKFIPTALYGTPSQQSTVPTAP